MVEAIRKKRQELINETPVFRTRAMEEEFGPGWYLALDPDPKKYELMKKTRRYQAWQLSKLSLT
jgi:hypothetical protein